MTYAGSKVPMDSKLGNNKIVVNEIARQKKDKNFKNVTINL